MPVQDRIRFGDKERSRLSEFPGIRREKCVSDGGEPNERERIEPGALEGAGVVVRFQSRGEGITRRSAVSVLSAAAVTLIRKSEGAAAALDIQKGPFAGTRESLGRYRVPEWFRDAKLGLWAHWGPQSAPEQGDWYARNMYLEGSPLYQWHVQHFGHPSKVGYKDVIPTFRAEQWEPEHLMYLYAKAGAKYFVSMGVHHDNFDLWNSKYQPRWNAGATGPRKDIVGMWGEAARKRGLKFGVSEHLSNSFDWFASAHRSDQTGPYAGAPYDGADPAYADLYHSYQGMPPDFARAAAPMGRIAPDSWKLAYFNRIKDLVDQHEPDLLYTDGPIPFEEYGLSLVAHHYNVSARRHGGRVEAIYTSKRQEDCAEGTCALDLERGIVDKIWPEPWQTDTCIGNWHYKRDITYKSPKDRGRHAGGYREPQWKSASEFSTAGQRRARRQGTCGTLLANGLDGRERRRYSRDAPVESVRRGPKCDSAAGTAGPTELQREPAERSDAGRYKIHHQGQGPICVCHGVASTPGAH